jgi:two-component system response regulator DesR
VHGAHRRPARRPGGLSSYSDGQASAAIGAVLGLSDGTVRNYLSEAIGKVGAANRTKDPRIAADCGWL